MEPNWLDGWLVDVRVVKRVDLMAVMLDDWLVGVRVVKRVDLLAEK